MIFSNEEERTLIEPDKYEVSILSIDKKEYTSKKDGSKHVGLNICYRIREDVNQAFKNRLIWEFCNETCNNETDGWWADTKKLSKLYRVTQEPNSKNEKGEPEWKVNDCDSCIQTLVGANLVITIDQEFNDYDGKDRNVIKYLSYEKSVYNQAPKFEDHKNNVGETLDSLENDIPF